MTESLKVNFYNMNKLIIHPTIKTDAKTKALWRKLFWTTGKDSDKYKAGCVDIFKAHLITCYLCTNSMFSE